MLADPLSLTHVSCVMSVLKQLGREAGWHPQDIQFTQWFSAAPAGYILWWAWISEITRDLAAMWPVLSVSLHDFLHIFLSPWLLRLSHKRPWNFFRVLRHLFFHLPWSYHAMKKSKPNDEAVCWCLNWQSSLSLVAFESSSLETRNRWRWFQKIPIQFKSLSAISVSPPKALASFPTEFPCLSHRIEKIVGVTILLSSPKYGT